MRVKLISIVAVGAALAGVTITATRGLPQHTWRGWRTPRAHGTSIRAAGRIAGVHRRTERRRSFMSGQARACSFWTLRNQARSSRQTVARRSSVFFNITTRRIEPDLFSVLRSAANTRPSGKTFLPRREVSSLLIAQWMSTNMTEGANLGIP